MAIEDERKYLIQDDSTFKGILKNLQLAPAQGTYTRVGKFEIRDSVFKSREYRYFDTFDRTLETNVAVIEVGILEGECSTASFRERGKDYVITVKIPTGEGDKRKELEKSISAAVGDFYSINPLLYLDEEQRQSIQILCGDRSLAEVVRLQVQTHRFNLYSADQLRVQVAVDEVVAKASIGIEKQFRELEIEVMKDGTPEDKELVALHFLDEYNLHLVRSSLPKFNKAMRLIRGEEIASDMPN